MDTAVHLAADVAHIDAKQTLFSETDGLDLMFRDARSDQFRLHGFGPLEPELHVVAGWSLLIGVAQYQDSQVPILLEDRGLRLQERSRFIGQSLRPTSKNRSV